MKEKNFIAVPNLGYPDSTSSKSSLFPYVGWNHSQACYQIQMKIHGKHRQFSMKFLDSMSISLEQQEVIKLLIEQKKTFSIFLIFFIVTDLVGKDEKTTSTLSKLHPTSSCRCWIKGDARIFYLEF